MKKVAVVITARPSYSRIKEALEEIQKHPELELQLIVAASALLDRYGRVVDQIEKDGFTVNERVFMVIEGENPTSMAKTTGLGLMELSTAFLNLRPDLVVSIADRYETLATAVASAYMNIPLVHIQGGEVTGSIDEKVRHAITKLADLHLVATEKAAENVVRMGEEPGRVVVTGCPSVDIARVVLGEERNVSGLLDRYGGLGTSVNVLEPFIVVLQHPVTTEYGRAHEDIEKTLQAVKERACQAVWFWPNVDAGSDGTSKGIRQFREQNPEARVEFLKSIEPHDFLRLLCASKCIVGNSSVAIRECSYLGVRAVNIGSRQDKRERGRNVIDVPHNTKAIGEAIQNCLGEEGLLDPEHIYGDGNAGRRIAEAIASWEPSFRKTLTY